MKLARAVGLAQRKAMAAPNVRPMLKRSTRHPEVRAERASKDIRSGGLSIDTRKYDDPRKPQEAIRVAPADEMFGLVFENILSL